MREILFKAKRTDNGEWVDGYLFDNGFSENKKMFIGGFVIEEYHGTADDKWDITGIDFCQIDPKTLCQYTGLTDKNGKRIWENDIVRCGGNLVVMWNKKYAGWCLSKKGWLYNHFFGESCGPEDCKVIGNIFDNPELLGGDID